MPAKIPSARPLLIPSDMPPSGTGRADARFTDRFFSRQRFMAMAAMVVLALAGWVIYAPGLGGGFIFDDYPNIVDNPLVQPAHASMAELSAAALSSPSSELKRPLASLSFAANYLASGLDAAAMKATNIALHILNGWLVFFLCRALLRRVHGAERTAALGATAFTMALAWLAAPINLTAVLYVVQRMESLANLFVLAGLIGYLRWRAKAMFRSRDALYLALWLLGCTAFGLLGKETAILLPLYALCIEAVIFRFGASGTRERKSLVAMYLLILGLPFLAGAFWIVPTLFDAGTWATRDFTLATRLMSEPRIILDYLAWTVVPTPSALSFYHDGFIASSGLLTPWTTLPSMLGLIALGIGGWMARRAVPLVSLGILFFLACQTLTGTVLPLELVYEHRNYFASFGVILAAGELCRLLADTDRWPRSRAVGMLPALGLIGWSMAMTFATANAWGSPLSLAAELAERGPHSHRAQYELGRAYIIASHYDRSSPYVAKAVPPLEAAAAMPGASILAEQALIFLYARVGLPIRESWWTSMQSKLRARPATVQDESSLGALAQCLRQEACHFDASRLRDAFDDAMNHPSPSARMCAMYADFAATTLHDDAMAFRLTEAAVRKAPSEPAYRINLARLAMASGKIDMAHEQIDALRKLNFGGRFDADIANLERRLPFSSQTARSPQ